MIHFPWSSQLKDLSQESKPKENKTPPVTVHPLARYNVTEVHARL